MPRRPRLDVLVGIPGSGKTTFARRARARRPGVRVISPDAIRDTLYPGYEAGQVDVRRIDNARVFREAYRAVAEALTDGADVIFDATSLTERRRRKLVALGRRHGARLIARYFTITLSEALRRNRARPRQVPPGIIAHMANLLQPPTEAEGFDRVIVMETL